MPGAKGTGVRPAVWGAVAPGVCPGTAGNAAPTAGWACGPGWAATGAGAGTGPGVAGWDAGCSTATSDGAFPASPAVDETSTRTEPVVFSARSAS